MVVLQRHTRHTRFLQNGRLGVCCCLIQTASRRLPPTSLCNGGKGRFDAILRRHDRQPAHDHNQRKPNLSCIPSGSAGGGMLHQSKLLCITPPRRHCLVWLCCVFLRFAFYRGIFFSFAICRRDDRKSCSSVSSLLVSRRGDVSRIADTEQAK